MSIHDTYCVCTYVYILTMQTQGNIIHTRTIQGWKERTKKRRKIVSQRPKQSLVKDVKANVSEHVLRSQWVSLDLVEEVRKRFRIVKVLKEGGTEGVREGGRKGGRDGELKKGI